MLSSAATVLFLMLLAGFLSRFTWLRPPRHYRGPVSDHFDGRRFFMPGRPFPHGLPAIIRKLREPFPPRWQVPAEPPLFDDPPLTVDGGQLRLSFVGHATMLIQTEGLNFLTDPFWSDRASPMPWAGPRRVVPPGIPFDDLPQIDVVIISHSHYDHMDVPTIRRLVADHDPLFVVPLGNDTLIRRISRDARVTALDWGEVMHVRPDVAIHAEPMHHWTARTPIDRNTSLWAAFVLSTPSGRTLFVGDSGYGDGVYFKPLRERYGGFRLAILPIGAYDPRWMMAYSHMNPEEAVQAFEDIGAIHAAAHHYATIQLTDEPIDEPAKRLAQALSDRGIAAERFRALRPGTVWLVPPGQAGRMEEVQGQAFGRQTETTSSYRGRGRS